MHMISVNSSAIRAIGYDGGTLCVAFHHSAEIYRHHHVPYSVYVAFMQAASMGRYYATRIRGKYH